MFGAAIAGMALGAIAKNARRQNQYYNGYAYPWAENYAPPARTNRTRKGRRCYQTEWDVAEGYVNVIVPCL